MIRLNVFDDEFVVVEAIRMMLRRLDSHVEVVGDAQDGISALEVIERTRPDVIITDIRMPGIDGLSMIEKAKEMVPDALFVIISGFLEFEYARTALELGVIGYIDKPITVDKLKAVFKRVEENQQQKIYGTEHHRLCEERISHLTEELNAGIRQNETDRIQERMEAILETLRPLYSDLAQYKLEVYKIVCCALGVFFEGYAAHEVDKHFPSYSNLELMHTYDEVDQYIRVIVESMVEKIQLLNTGSHHQVVIKILDYMAHNLEKNFGLNEMADMVRMNPNYVSNLFKEEVGTSFVKYLTGLRMVKAKQLLLEGEKVTVVSEKVGYGNYRYFCNLFKRYEGKTPSEYKGARK